MRGILPRTLTLIAILLLFLPGWAGGTTGGAAAKGAAQAPAPPDPDKILRDMADFLKSQGQFSFRAEVTDDQVYSGGKKLQYSLDLKVAVRRPDKIRIDGQGDLENQEVFYDGLTLTLYNKDHNLYAITPMPPTIDEALTKAYHDFGLQVALADLVCTNAYDLMMKNVTHTLYVGLHRVRGVLCHHLAFDQKDMQWQIWIEVGDKPLPRKLLINQKKLQAEPQWTATLTDWNLSPQLPANMFTFVPPTGSHQIDFVPPAKAAAPKPTPRSPKQGEKS
jgi:hypothetical protein